MHLVSLELKSADIVARINADADISYRSKMTFSDMQKREKTEISVSFSLIGSMVYRTALSLEMRRLEFKFHH